MNDKEYTKIFSEQIINDLENGNFNFNTNVQANTITKNERGEFVFPVIVELSKISEISLNKIREKFSQPDLTAKEACESFVPNKLELYDFINSLNRDCSVIECKVPENFFSPQKKMTIKVLYVDGRDQNMGIS